jgi:hypothetical protein
MNYVHPLILGDGDVDWVKLIPFAVVGIIWILRLVASVSKQSTRNQRSTIAPPPPISAASMNLPPPVQPPRQLAAKAGKPQRAPTKPRSIANAASRQSDAIRQMLAGLPTAAAGRRREPALPKRSQPAAQAVAPGKEEVPRPSSAKAVCLVDGPSLARRMQPALLRYQFILTEVLRPPLALREDDELE